MSQPIMQIRSSKSWQLLNVAIGNLYARTGILKREALAKDAIRRPGVFGRGFATLNGTAKESPIMSGTAERYTTKMNGTVKDVGRTSCGAGRRVATMSAATTRGLKTGCSLRGASTWSYAARKITLGKSTSSSLIITSLEKVPNDNNGKSGSNQSSKINIAGKNNNDNRDKTQAVFGPYYDHNKTERSEIVFGPYYDYNESERTHIVFGPYDDHNKDDKSLTVFGPYNDHSKDNRSHTVFGPYNDHSKNNRSHTVFSPYNDHKEGDRSHTVFGPYDDHNKSNRSHTVFDPYNDHNNGDSDNDSQIVFGPWRNYDGSLLDDGPTTVFGPYSNDIDDNDDDLVGATKSSRENISAPNANHISKISYTSLIFHTTADKWGMLAQMRKHALSPRNRKDEGSREGGNGYKEIEEQNQEQRNEEQIKEQNGNDGNREEGSCYTGVGGSAHPGHRTSLSKALTHILNWPWMIHAAVVDKWTLLARSFRREHYPSLKDAAWSRSEQMARNLSANVRKGSEDLMAQTVGRLVPGECHRVMPESFKLAVTSPHKMADLYSNYIFKDKHVHLDTLADELGTLDGEIQSTEGEIDKQLEKSPTTFRFEDLDALAPTSNEPPTGLQRFLENAVVQKQLMLKAMEAEVADGRTVNRNANSSSDRDSSEKSSSTQNNDGWTELRMNIDEVTEGAASKFINGVQSQTRQLQPVVKSFLRR